MCDVVVVFQAVVAAGSVVPSTTTLYYDSELAGLLV
jgi:hypothetical protein